MAKTGRPRRYTDAQIRANILQLLQHSPGGCTKHQLHVAAGYSNYVYRVIDDMCQEGIITYGEKTVKVRGRTFHAYTLTLPGAQSPPSEKARKLIETHRQWLALHRETGRRERNQVDELIAEILLQLHLHQVSGLTTYGLRIHICHHEHLIPAALEKAQKEGLVQRTLVDAPVDACNRTTAMGWRLPKKERWPVASEEVVKRVVAEVEGEGEGEGEGEPKRVVPIVFVTG